MQEKFEMIPKVEFVIDKEKDKHMAYRLLNNSDHLGNLNRAYRMGLTESEFNLIHTGKKYGDMKEIVNRIFEPRYSKSEKEIKNKQRQYQEDWKKFGDEFFSEVERITGHEWKYKEYLVILSPFNVGVSNRLYNFVFRGVKESPLIHRRVTAHEILMTHLWDIFKKYEGKIDDEKLWEINEITTTAILGLEPKLDKFWAEPLKGYDQFLKGYNLELLQQKLKKIYLNKKDFNDYLTKTIKVYKK